MPKRSLLRTRSLNKDPFRDSANAHHFLQYYICCSLIDGSFLIHNRFGSLLNKAFNMILTISCSKQQHKDIHHPSIRLWPRIRSVSFSYIISSVRSSNSHPDLLVTHQHPTFSDLACLPLYNNIGLSLSEPLQLYQKQSLDSSAG